MRKICSTVDEALNGVLFDGMTVMSGGFGPCGVPVALLEAICDSDVHDLRVISIDAGQPDYSVGRLIASGKVSKLIAAFVGENPQLVAKHLSGEIEVEFSPMGTLVERIRAGGAGLAAFYTQTGYGTLAASGKESREFNGQFYLMETALRADLALVRARSADRFGNLCFNKTARNSNPVIATAADVVIAEVEEIAERNENCIHTPGIYIDRLFVAEPHEKRIEKRTVRSPRQA